MVTATTATTAAERDTHHLHSLILLRRGQGEGGRAQCGSSLKLLFGRRKRERAKSKGRAG